MSKQKSAPSPQKNAFEPKSYVKGTITQEEVIQAKASFDLFDSDKGGSVDIKELKAAMTSLGFQSKNAAIFQMISDLDSDGNGTIDFQQWLSLLTKRVNDRDSRANIAKIFSIFDSEASGFISMKNLRIISSELGEKIDQKELQELMDRADTNFDGLVSFEQFYSIVTRPIKQ